MRAIACAVLIIGLLKFCQDAPELFKTLFSAGGDMLKGMNPFGAAKRDLQAAGKTLTQAKDAGKAVGHALGTPFRAGAAIGKGAAGAIAGAKAGANANEDQNFFNKLVGGARGLVAGGSAGVHNQGFKGTTTAGEYAGANAATAKARGIFGDAQGDLNKSYGILMDRAKSDIDKEKDKKKAADENYKQQVNEYVNGRLSDDNYINSIIAQQQSAAVDQKLNEKVAAQAAANNVSEDVIRNNATMMSRLQSEAAREVAPIGREEALGIAKEQASNEAKALYEADKEKAKTDADNKIAEIMGNQLASEPEMRNAQQASGRDSDQGAVGGELCEGL